MSLPPVMILSPGQVGQYEASLESWGSSKETSLALGIRSDPGRGGSPRPSLGQSTLEPPGLSEYNQTRSSHPRTFGVHLSGQAHIPRPGNSLSASLDSTFR